MKKIIACLLMLILLFSASGCEETIQPPTDGKEEDIVEPSKKELPGVALANAIWHRPNVMGDETNLDGIKKTLDTFKKCGINIIYLETIYHGMAMYKSNLIPYYSGFSGNNYEGYPDYLSAFVAEANKREIEVHAWVEDFYIGITEGSLAKSHPDWLLVTKNGSTKQSEGNGYLFLDPANPKVHEFLINLYLEMLKKNPDIAGLNLDYIRYPVSTKTDDTGYTEYAMQDFLNNMKHEVPEGKTLREEFDKVLKNNYTQWTIYRAMKVTTFVKGVREMCDKNFDNMILSTAVFPNQSQSYETKKQDFTTWLKNQYIDVVTPMAYYDDLGTLEKYLKEMVNSVGDSNVYCYSGLSCIYHNLSADQVIKQIDKSIELSNGFVIFGSQKLLGNESYIKLLENKFKALEYHIPHQE